jgi:phosphatidylinositol alpha-mannosyltransferase
VPASDAALLAAALRELLQDPEHRAALGGAALRRAAAFTWEETARRMRAVYEEALACA